MVGHRLQQFRLVDALAPRRRVHLENLHLFDGDRAAGAATPTLVHLRVVAWRRTDECACINIREANQIEGTKRKEPIRPNQISSNEYAKIHQ
jgi:hypothetical protein